MIRVVAKIGSKINLKMDCEKSHSLDSAIWIQASDHASCGGDFAVVSQAKIPGGIVKLSVLDLKLKQQVVSTLIVSSCRSVTAKLETLGIVDRPNGHVQNHWVVNSALVGGVETEKTQNELREARQARPISITHIRALASSVRHGSNDHFHGAGLGAICENHDVVETVQPGLATGITIICIVSVTSSHGELQDFVHSRLQIVAAAAILIVSVHFWILSIKSDRSSRRERACDRWPHRRWHCGPASSTGFSTGSHRHSAENDD